MKTSLKGYLCFSGIICCAIASVTLVYAKTLQADITTDPSFRVYQVNKKVSDFPDEKNLSTPESAYAVINQLIVNGGRNEEWNRVHHISMDGLATEKPTPEFAEMYRNAIIREVHIYKERIARVFAEVKINPLAMSSLKDKQQGELGFDQRSLVFVDGQWLNDGHDGLADSLEQARTTFAKKSEVIYRLALKEMGEEIPEETPISKSPNDTL